MHDYLRPFHIRLGGFGFFGVTFDVSLVIYLLHILGPLHMSRSVWIPYGANAYVMSIISQGGRADALAHFRLKRFLLPSPAIFKF